jgi:hypothetical protein
VSKKDRKNREGKEGKFAREGEEGQGCRQEIVITPQKLD